MLPQHFQLTITYQKPVCFDINVYHQSAQVIRFDICFLEQQMKLEKRLLVKKQSWKILYSSFSFQHPQSARNLGILCQLLDDYIKKEKDKKPME